MEQSFPPPSPPLPSKKKGEEGSRSSHSHSEHVEGIQGKTPKRGPKWGRGGRLGVLWGLDVEVVSSVFISWRVRNVFCPSCVLLVNHDRAHAVLSEPVHLVVQDRKRYHRRYLIRKLTHRASTVWRKSSHAVQSWIPVPQVLILN